MNRAAIPEEIEINIDVDGAYESLAVECACSQEAYDECKHVSFLVFHGDDTTRMEYAVWLAQKLDELRCKNGEK